MSLAVVLSPQAAQDAKNAKAYYATISPPLALAFIDELSIALRFVQEHPNGGALVKGSIPQFPVERFPYLIVYVVHRDVLRIIRGFHTRQNPRRKLRTKG